MRKAHVIGCLLFAILALAMPSASSAQIAVGVSVHIGPPALPVYAQPVCPGPGYLWTPGYWAYGEAGYYWVPGTWVVAPVGMLWTPGYWGWRGGGYFWHAGYWGPHVGFYGGINYGFGYGGVGFVGGEWRGREFAYNTAVMHVDTTIVHTTYVNRTVINNTVVNNHYSFNGPGGVTAHATSAEMAAEHEHHMEPLAAQRDHEHSAASNPQFRYSENHGRPAVAATGKPGEFSGHSVAAARGNNEFHPPAHNEAMAHANNSNAHANNSNAHSGNNAEAAHSSNSGFHPPKNNGNSGSPHANNEAHGESHNSRTPAPSHGEKERRPQK